MALKLFLYWLICGNVPHELQPILGPEVVTPVNQLIRVYCPGTGSTACGVSPVSFINMQYNTVVRWRTEDTASARQAADIAFGIIRVDGEI